LIQNNYSLIRGKKYRSPRMHESPPQLYLLFSIDRMDRKKFIENWVAVFNDELSDDLAEMYHDAAINHQVANDPVIGKENIRKMFAAEFATAEMVCIIENIFVDGEWAILEWRDPLGLRGCGFFHIIDGKIKFQRGYWDKLSFLRQHGLPVPG
jgi:hypothetical protein